MTAADHKLSSYPLATQPVVGSWSAEEASAAAEEASAEDAAAMFAVHFHDAPVTSVLSATEAKIPATVT